MTFIPMKNISLMTLTLTSLLALSSCTTRLMDLTVTSSKNIDLNDPQGYVVSNNSRTRGKDTSHIVLFFPLGYPDVKEAMDRAIEKNGHNAVGLSNMTLESKWWYIPFIYGQMIYTVEGDPIYKK